MFRYIFIFISIALPISIFEGRVLDINDFPIADVNVQILETELGTSTDSEGYFFIDRSDILITIKLSHVAYQSKIIKINPSFSTMTIKMTENILQSERIVVTGTKGMRHIKDTPILTHAITSDDISDASYIGVKDMLEIVLPNVQMVASNHGDNRVKIQGLDNKYMAFLVDGDRVTGEFAGNIDFSMFNLNNVEKIEIVEGAMSTLYGSSAMAGVVNIITKKRRDPFWLSLSFLDDSPIVNSASLNSGFDYKKINYQFNTVYKSSDGYDLTPKSQFFKTLEEYYNMTSQHKIIYTIKDNHNIEFHYKDYYSNMTKYRFETYFDPETLEYFSGLIKAQPLKRYRDYNKKVKYNYLSPEMRLLKWSYLEESCNKFYYYPSYYDNNPFYESGEEFIQGGSDRKEFNFEFSYETFTHKRLLGVELIDESYSAYNIYNAVDIPIFFSIFDGIDQTKHRSLNSVYLHDQWNIKNNSQLALGLRYNSDKKILSSLSYLIKRDSGYNYRLSYSSGYRIPSIKELYYSWTDHDPNIFGDPGLESSFNHYFSFSLDKRTDINDFSVDFYSNNINNMISTAYLYPEDEYGVIIEDLTGLYYQNFDNVIIYGINIHYFRKITNKLNLRFAYNFTEASSSSAEILEGIGKHALRLNLMHVIDNNLKMVINVKYNGKKFNFDQESGDPFKTLDDYIISDIYFIDGSELLTLKFGIKNIFNYKDISRFDDANFDILNNYDPGRRVFIEYSFNFKGEK